MVVNKLDHAPLNINYFEDSDVIVFHDVEERNIYRSTDAGAKWERVSSIPEGVAAMLYMHTFEQKTAFVMTQDSKHYKTHDRGETWEKFDTGVLASAFRPEVLVFHADDPKRIIFNGMECDGIFCDEQAMYTTDGFKTKDVLRAFTAGCWWAKSTKEFSSGDAEKDKDRTLCIVRDPFSLFREDQKLHMSDSFFKVVNDKIDEFEPNLDTNMEVAGVISLAGVKKYILVATSSMMSDEMALYVTADAVHWHRAMFPTDDSHDHSHQITQEAYTVLESTNYSIQIDVMTSHPSNPMGVIFTSNSNGTYFTENVPYTNRNTKGHVDFEQISRIQGIYLVNVVENGKEVDKSGEEKIIVTKITFDDGRTFEEVKAGEDTIHLHSVTQLDNIGRVFSSPAPGLVMGNGNTGKSLGEFIDSNLYVSDNAGLTWKEALKGPHKYEFGDSGSILVAIKDSTGEDVDEFSYSLDHGDNWKTVSLPNDLKIKPYLLTTTQDSTSLKFLLLGEHEKTYHIISIDFSSLDKKKCTNEDLEDWHARVDDDGKPTCLMGHKQTYQRRKKSADCFIESEFHDPEPKTEDCECTDADFECDYNFQRDSEDHKVCKQVGRIPAPKGACKADGDGKFMGSSGWRLIPGNTCKRTKGEQKDDEAEKKCSDDASSPEIPGSGEISHKPYVFEAKLGDFEKIYLENGQANLGDDETVIVRPVKYESGKMQIENRLWRTTDHGKSWDRILDGEEIQGIYPHLYFKNMIFFTTKTDKVIYSFDSGHSFHSFKAPTAAADGFTLSFHPDNKNWLIWRGDTCEKVGGSESCYHTASISTDRGDNWKTLLRYVERCEFTGHSAYNFRPLKQIVCLAREEEEKDPEKKVIMSSNDFFDEDKNILKNATAFATMSEFILVATKDYEDGSLKALASLDGKHFEPAHFPFNFHDTHQSSYTVLDSSTHAINLFVATDVKEGHVQGSIIKSNSNGTSYVLSATNVNADDSFYVDFEKIPGLEGVTVINVVANPDKKDGKKEVQTKISHNDGAEWAYLAPPKKDADDKSYKCSSDNGDNKCALHLHHYTERDDKRKTFAAASTVGLIFGVGNVGSKLEDIKDADTFMTTDGGITWKNVKKGHWTWQYGDQGSIIVLVQRATHGNGAKTKIVSYSLDEGNTWTDYKFYDEEVTVLDITTLRSGTSRNFLVWCKTDKGELFSVNLDFTGLADKPCKWSKDDEEDPDYYLWSPKHPLQEDDCLFGHVAKYLRKKTDRKCYNKQNLQKLQDYDNCQCSRRDYECAYNFELDNVGQCKLVPGLKPLSGQDWCQQHPNETTWYEPTGYRRVPLSTCQGGKEMDKASTEHPCDGYEDEFEKKHRSSGWAIFFAIIIPFACAGGIGWYVYCNWSGKFGQIRLGENSSTFDSDQPWIKYPVIAVSAVAAVLAALPLVVAGLWRSAVGAYSRVRGGSGESWFAGRGTRRFTTRDSFARGRGDYAIVDDDEGELLGEESDEEV
ncbi:Fc.00g064620.m01.CDS01 [Cosmosporella sp. VM-42]